MYGLQLALSASGRFVIELVKVDYPLAQVGEADLERIEPGMILDENLRNILRLIPLQSHNLTLVKLSPYAKSSTDFFSNACLMAASIIRSANGVVASFRSS